MEVTEEDVVQTSKYTEGAVSQNLHTDQSLWSETAPPGMVAGQINRRRGPDVLNQKKLSWRKLWGKTPEHIFITGSI